VSDQLLLAADPGAPFRVPVALGYEVMDVSCRCCSPSPVRVMKIFPWGLRVRSIVEGHSDEYDCTRWEALHSHQQEEAGQ